MPLGSVSEGCPLGGAGLAFQPGLDEGHAPQALVHAGDARGGAALATPDGVGEVAIEVGQGLQITFGMATGQAQALQGLRR